MLCEADLVIYIMVSSLHGTSSVNCVLGIVKRLASAVSIYILSSNEELCEVTSDSDACENHIATRVSSASI